MFTVWVKVDAIPERVEEFLAGALENAATSVATEAGCVRFDVHRDVDVPHRFYFSEWYVDESAFRDGHCGSEHFRTYALVEAACAAEGSKELTFSTIVAAPDAG